MNWNKRSEEKEELDDLEFSGASLEKSLDELGWVYQFLGGRFITVRTLKHAMHALGRDADRPIRILDAGCGGGDSLRSIAKWARKNNRDLELQGIDANPSTIEYAKNKSAAFPEINYKTENIFSKEMDWGKYDLIMFSLILHHFTMEEIDTILSRCVQAKVPVVVINDLHRHPLAYYSFAALTKLIRFSKISRDDGLISIKKAFKKRELEQILNASGYNEYKITWQWAFRYEAIAMHRNH